MKKRIRRYGDITKAYVPEWWSKMTVALFHDNLVMGNLISRDFQPDIANEGDIVNTRVVIPVGVHRRENNEDIEAEQLDARNIPVRLNQHIYSSFDVPDKLQTLAFKDILTEFLVPQVRKMVERVERIILAQAPRFYMNAAGRIGQLGGPTARTTILEARQVLNNNKVPVEGRNFIWNPNSETKVLDTDIFTSAEKVGDDGTALRTANLGQKLGFYHFMSQCLPYGIPINTTPSSMAVVGNVNPGATTVTLDAVAGAEGARVGAWVTFAGDGIPHQILQISGSVLTITPAVQHPIVDGAEVYASGAPIATNQAITAGQGYIVVTPAVRARLPVGTSFTLANDTDPFTVIEYDAAKDRVTLDRPIEADYVTATPINLFPAADLNFAFNRWALTLVNRPLAIPYGVPADKASVVSDGGISIRCIQSYDDRSLRSKINLDFLMGITVLKQEAGCLVYG